MEWREIIIALGSAITALGGWKIVEVIIFYFSKRRVAGAEADVAETKAQVDEFHLYQEQIVFAQSQVVELQRQLKEKEVRFQEQTNIVRDLNKQLIDKIASLGRAESRIVELETERKMKLCERKGCAKRQPQSGY